MGIEENKEAVRLYHEIMNNKDYSMLTEVMHENYNVRSNQSTQNGIEERIRHQEYLFTVMPDRHNELIEMIAEGDKVVAYTTMTATHTGADYMGHPANGKKIEFDTIAIYTLKDGKISSGRFIGETIKGFQQMGWYPPLPEEK